MACSSAATHRWKYDVFLSFRGKDTRNNFTSHLYDALCSKQIKTFIDHELERGEEITPVLLKTIEQSRISVVIFSKNYVSSPWCVDELVKILECRQIYGQTVFPVFYHVDPFDVDKQTGSFEYAFAELENNFNGKLDKVPRWRADLKNAASISGWDSQVTCPDSKLVREVVQTIWKKLNRASSSDLRGLVGINSHIEEINKLLSFGLQPVCIIGIWGMGGIGKTTIAGAFFSRLSSQYESCHFLQNVREEWEKCGQSRLRDKLLSKLLEEENLHIDTPYIPTFIKDRISQKKVLLVLDDVNDVRQFQFLIEGRDLLGAGSAIVVTSSDKQVLKNVVDEIYQVKELNFHDALQLFSLNAFKENWPPEAYTELSVRAINYAKGNPLALKVLGSFMFNNGRDFWESTLNDIESIPELKIYDVLRIGFDALCDHNMKSIFLDIACFFKGEEVNFVKGILDGCGFKTGTGFSVLEDRCLIKISNGKVQMHDLLQEMAHVIVRQESIKELGRRSRLWSPKDVYQVLTKNLGTGNVEGIFLDVSKMREMELSSGAFARMYNLRLLKLYNSEVGSKCTVQLPHGLEFLSDELRYLHWEGYPLRYLPSNFHAENLVQLNLSSSKVKQLWSGNQNLVNLKEIDLSNCEHLTSMPDLSQAINLERLILQFCTSLIEVPLSIQHLNKLIDLDMKHCTSLIILPRCISSRDLETLNLSGCSNLKMCPEMTRNVRYLNLNETAIEELPQSTGYLRKLIALNLRNCKHLGNLPDSIRFLKSLLIIDLSGCSNITRFPDVSGDVRYLYLSGTAIEELPSSIGRLQGLISLDLVDCQRLKNLPSTISLLGNLKKLNLSGCSSITKFPEVSRSIKELYLDGTAVREIPSSIWCLSDLVILQLRNCPRFENLPISICKLKSLQRLNLSGCRRFQNFPEILEPMPSLRYLYLDQTSITKLRLPIKYLMGLSCLQLGNCKNLASIKGLGNLGSSSTMNLIHLRKLDLNGCGLRILPSGLEYLSTLEVLDLSGNGFQTVPASISNLSELQHLALKNCKRLCSLDGLPPRLTKLDADNCTSLQQWPCLPSNVVHGNIFEFSFTNCSSLSTFGPYMIIAYASKRFCLFNKSQMSNVPAGTSSCCCPGNRTLKWFNRRSKGSMVTIQLPSHWARGQFLGFALCAVIAFEPNKFISHGLQVKCTYHFRNKRGDCIHLCCLHGWYDRKIINSDHIFFGFDPCLIARKDDRFSDYSEVSIEFHPEDIENNVLDCCRVINCGVRLLGGIEEGGEGEEGGEEEEETRMRKRHLQNAIRNEAWRTQNGLYHPSVYKYGLQNGFGNPYVSKYGLWRPTYVLDPEYAEENKELELGKIIEDDLVLSSTSVIISFLSWMRSCFQI